MKYAWFGNKNKKLYSIMRPFCQKSELRVLLKEVDGLTRTYEVFYARDYCEEGKRKKLKIISNFTRLKHNLFNRRKVRDSQKTRWTYMYSYIKNKMSHY